MANNNNNKRGNEQPACIWRRRKPSINIYLFVY
jgi:hypothetical protein